jgi:hypothetical protein
MDRLDRGQFVEAVGVERSEVVLTGALVRGARYFLTCGHSLSESGRKAWSGGIVATSL